jgi:hypothetical protein
MLLNLNFNQALMLAMFADGCWHEADNIPDQWLPWFDIKEIDGLFGQETTLYRLLPEHKQRAEVALIYLGRQVPSSSGLAIEKREWLGIQVAEGGGSIEKGLCWLWHKVNLNVISSFHQPGCTRLMLQSPAVAIARLEDLNEQLPAFTLKAWGMITAQDVKSFILSHQWAEVVVWG